MIRLCMRSIESLPWLLRLELAKLYFLEGVVARWLSRNAQKVWTRNGSRSITLLARIIERSNILDRQISTSRICESFLSFIFLCFRQCCSELTRALRSEQAFQIHQRLFNSKVITEQKSLQKDILETKSQLLKTSAQDEFAKWAKLRRKIDKGLVDLEKLSAYSSGFVVTED